MGFKLQFNSFTNKNIHYLFFLTVGATSMSHFV